MTASLSFTLIRNAYDKKCVEVKMEIVCQGEDSYSETEATAKALTNLRQTFDALIIRPGAAPG